MTKKIKNLSIIIYSLAALYGFSIIYYIVMARDPSFRSYSIILSILFAGLFGGSCFIILSREWGRRLLVGLNVVMFFYLVFLWLKFPQYVPIVYPLVNIIVAVFFSQDKIKFQITQDWQNIRKSILVVDDDEGFQRTIKRILLPSGYSVLTATTGERGLQVARTQHPDMIILDVILPGIKGREICSQLKDNPDTRDIPVVFLTAKDSPDDIDAEIAAGAISHLTKPVDAKSLLEEIKKIIG